MQALLWIALSVVVGCYQNVEAWRYARNIAKPLRMQVSMNSATPASPSASLVKKGKRKLVEELKKELQEQGADHEVYKYLQSKERPVGIIKPIDFYVANKNKFKTLSVLVEYNKKAKTGFITGMPMPEIMGGVYRDCGAKGIVVSLDQRLGGASMEEFRSFTKEQAKARLFLPPPLPIVWNDLIIDHVQIDFAATLGASAVVLYADLLDDFSATVAYCKQLELEPIVMIKNEEEAKMAMATGVRCMCLHSMDEPELIALREKLPSNEEQPDLLFIAKLRPETDFSTYFEIDLAWVLRDFGFHSVWPSPEAIHCTGMSDIYPAISALKSKASRQFLSPRQFLMERKKEGATEYLGDILY